MFQWQRMHFIDELQRHGIMLRHLKILDGLESRKYNYLPIL